MSSQDENASERWEDEGGTIGRTRKKNGANGNRSGSGRNGGARGPSRASGTARRGERRTGERDAEAEEVGDTRSAGSAPARGDAHAEACRERDLARSPGALMVGWGLPVLMILTPSVVAMPLRVAVALLAGGFTWMGVACLVNARHCGRRHCFLSGPLFLIGAVLVVLVGSGTIDLGRDGLRYIVWGTAALVPLTFLPEWRRGRYRGS